MKDKLEELTHLLAFHSHPRDVPAVRRGVMNMHEHSEKLTSEQQQEFLDPVTQMQPREGESFADWRRQYADFEKTGETELPADKGEDDESGTGSEPLWSVSLHRRPEADRCRLRSARRNRASVLDHGESRSASRSRRSCRAATGGAGSGRSVRLNSEITSELGVFHWSIRNGHIDVINSAVLQSCMSSCR